MEIRDKIIEEATVQFMEYGIRYVTMDSIASALGMSKRTVYEIFKDKTTLVHSCLEVVSEKHRKKNVEICQSANNVIEMIFLFMREGIKAMKDINPVFFRDMEKLYPKTWKNIQESHEKEAINLTEEILQNGIEQELFRPEINISIVARLFHKQMNLLADDKIFPRDEYNYIDVFQNLVTNFVRGISTKKGIEIIESTMNE